MRWKQIHRIKQKGKKSCDNSPWGKEKPLSHSGPHIPHDKMSLYRFIAGVADEWFRTGWSGPHPTHGSLTPSAKRTCHGSPPRLLHGERVRPPSEIRQERNRGEGVSCARPRTPRRPQPKKKKYNRGLFGKWGVVVPFLLMLYGGLLAHDAAGLFCSSRGNFAPVVYRPLHHE